VDGGGETDKFIARLARVIQGSPDMQVAQGMAGLIQKKLQGTYIFVS
jgi:hypothetical protein